MGRLSKQQRHNVTEEIEDALDSLSYDLDYDIECYHDENITIFDIDLSDNLDEPEGWDEAAEDAVSDIAGDWGGWTSWDGWTLCLSIPDDDD